MSQEKIQEMEKILNLQKKLYIEEETPSLELRQDRLNRCVAVSYTHLTLPTTPYV